MILSTNQYHRDYDESPELKCVSLDVCDPISGQSEDLETQAYLEEVDRRAMLYADEYDCSYDAAWCAVTMSFDGF